MDYRKEVLRNCPDFYTHTFAKQIDLAALGVSGEAGEVADLAAALVSGEKGLDEIIPQIKKELGDVYWYLEYACATLAITREEALTRAPYNNWREGMRMTGSLDLLLAAADLCAKAGLVTDTVKKVLHHGVLVTKVDDRLLAAIGSTYRVLEHAGNLVNFTREEIQQANIDKLRARHPNGWTPESQQAKIDEKAG
jgi:NTP pyrophosphatase (non-canonical NTP hydrolase)